jgi:hypothetical protein
MRESEIYNILSKFQAQMHVNIGRNWATFANGLLDLAIYRETWEQIIYSKKRLCWFIILYLMGGTNAQDYFAELFRENKQKQFEAIQKEQKNEKPISNSNS